MTENLTNKSRRRFIKLGVAGLAAAPLGHVLLSKSAFAQEKLDENDPQAKALKYTHDVTTATGVEPGRNCANCQLYTGEAGSEWGPCNLFAGKLVSAKGWCSAWVAKAG